MPPGVTVDLRGAQSPGYRERGIGRYAVDLTRALVARHPDLIQRIRVDPDLPPARGLGDLSTSGLLSTDAVSRDGTDRGGTYHIMAPFDLDSRMADLWPRAASAQAMSLVVTVYDLIPEVMPDVYLADPGVRRRYRARRELVRGADAVVTLSASAASDVVDRLGLPPSRVHVVGAACGDAFGPPASRPAGAAAARAAIDGLGPRWIAYNGANEPRKNMDRLVEAYARLPVAVRDRWQLVVVCALEPLARNHYEVRARQLGIDGRLLLTGFLPDRQLAMLYQGADLVVFPSLYEGYGLPVAEAMACGAPVVASAGSAVAELVAPDATFDPRDTGDIREALARALADDGYRRGLIAWSARPQPTWTDVADRVAGVHEHLLNRPRANRPGVDRPGVERSRVNRPGVGHSAPALGGAPWRRRPRVALVTPWPPQRTGVADYSARLVAALDGRAEVDLFVDGDTPGAAGLSDRTVPAVGLAMTPPALPRVTGVRGGYDAVIVALGNSEFHAGALRLLRTGGLRSGGLRPIVIAHDVRLTGLYWHSAARGAVPEGFAAALGAMYPGLGDIVEDGRVPPDVADRYGVVMAREAIGCSGRFLVTSEHAAAMARLDAAPGDAGRVGVFPLAYPAVVHRHAEDEDDGLIASFGLVDPSKKPELLVASLALLAPRRPAARLVFVGPTAPATQQRLEALAADLGTAERVSFVGYTSDAAYRGWLRRACIAVQLRRRTNGEMSAAIGDCLAHGVATVVTDLGPQRDLPDSVVKVPADADADALAATVGALLDDRATRHRLGAAGQAAVAGHGFAEAADQLIELIARRRAECPCG